MRRLLGFVLLAALAHAAPRPAKRPPDPAAEAAQALFVRSGLEQARALAARALARDPRDVRALFVEMEAAAAMADAPAVLAAALRLCEARTADPRANIAGARLLELAANSRDFRAAVPRIERLLLAPSPQAAYLRAALLAAALDGLPGLDPAALAAQAGIVTRWRVRGPFGELPNVDWEARFEPEARGVGGALARPVAEDFQFLDGNVALPGYLRERDGVFYAESTLEAARGEMVLRFESAGTAQVFVDGQSVLVKDDRLRATPQIAHAALRLGPGEHRLLVKFLPTAEPWRLALLPAPAAPAKTATLPALEAEQRYLRAAASYWRGDAAATLATLPQPGAVAEELLLGRALAAQPGEAAAHFRAALALAPAALAAAYELALYDFEAGRVEEAAAAAERVAALRPGFAPALDLLAEAADRLGWDRKAMEAYENRIRLRPSCDVLLKAARLFAKSARYDRARALEEEARDCAPGSLAYAGALSERGEHAAAAEAARRVLERTPLDREARALLVRELRLAGEVAGAGVAAAQLARLAPNRREPAARRVPERDDDFYLPYRRDGLALARATAARRFSGGPIVELLNDKAVRLAPDGSLQEYVHKLTRVLNKEGIDRYGEVAVPAGAELLELRTIKADGRVFEPELHEHKQTISMPALAAEDVIELEYVLHRPARDGLAEHPASFRATFGSFRAPTLHARFVAEVPAERAVRIADADNTRARVSQRDGFTVRTWEADDIPQALQEPALPAGANLPVVAVLPRHAGWSEIRDHYRELAMAAAHLSPELVALGAGFRGSEEARARQVVAWVQQKVAVSDPEAFAAGAVPSAEESLAAGEGSRTAAVLALAHAAGLEARLVLAARPGTTRELALATYTRPLVEFVTRERTWVVDVESDGLAFGALPPEVAPGEALEVPLRHPRGERALVALASQSEREENLARAEVRLDAAGNAVVELEIALGSYRGAQMRATLRGMPAGRRQQVFEQVALRIFPGATAVQGSLRNEDDPERPFTLAVRCEVARLFDLERLAREDTLDIDQLVPTLGLRRMYASAAARRFPLFIDVPLVESASFRVHLPEAVRVAQRARDTRLTSDFGSYAVEFRQADAHTLEVRRSFRIPAQVVAPGAYAAFAHFAARIEEAERQRLALARSLTGGAALAAAR